MIRQTMFGSRIEKTSEELTTHGGLALVAEHNHGTGLREFVDGIFPIPAGPWISSLGIRGQSGPGAL